MKLNTRRSFLTLALVATVLIAAGSGPAPASSAEKLIDMTFPFSEASIYWPTDKPFTPTVVFKGISDGGWWYASNRYEASEHGGTHVDAPII